MRFKKVTEASSLTHESLLFRYLGVPICAKKISNAQCEALLENMIGRIRVWISKNLSYTARSQLINVVL